MTVPFWLDDTLAVLRNHTDERLGPTSADLAHAVLAGFDKSARGSAADPLPAVHIPAIVFRCLSSDALPARLLASCAAVFISIRMLDDLMDGDTPRFIPERGLSEVVLASQIFFGFSYELLADGAGDGDRSDEIGAEFRHILSEMSEGQLADELAVSVETTAEQVTAKIEAKSGIMLAGFARILALSAAATPAQVRAAGDFGHHVAMARQHRNDLSELGQPDSSDLRNAKATMALALALEPLDMTGRVSLLDELGQAAAEPDGYGPFVTNHMVTAILEVRLLIDMHIGAARAALRQVGTAPAGHFRANKVLDGLAQS